LTGNYNTTGSARDVTVSGNYAYVADASAGLQIIDISSPTSPTFIGNYCSPQTNNVNPSSVDVAISGNYAYLAEGVTGLQIIDISNPSSPTLTGAYNTPGYARGVELSGNYAYVADENSGLQIIDILNPSSPTLIGTYNTSGAAFDVTVRGNYAYVADGYHGLDIIDISTPSSPTFIGNYNTTQMLYGEKALRVTVIGDYAYVADWIGGLLIIDISIPSSPTLVNTYNTPGYANDVTVRGNFAFIAKDNAGLDIIDVGLRCNQDSLILTFQTSGCMDSLALNYSASAGCDDGSCMYPCTAAPYSENFDAGMGTWTTANTGSGNYTGWYSGTYTPSSATGPQSGDVTGGNFMYIETSSTGGPYTLTSECLDISALAAPALRYQYHMYGASMGTLDVTVNGDTLFTMSGDQGNQWNPHQIDLSAYVGTDITVVFIGSRGTSFTGDMAIDAVEVDEMTVLSIPGCMDPLALNYNSAANVSDSSCNYHCANTSAYGSATADPLGSVTVSTCNYLTEYSTISGVGAGESYTASISGVNANPGYIVVYEGSSAGNFVAQGSAPLTWTSTVAGTYYIHWLVDSSCATATGCHTTTLTGNQILTVAGCMDALACNYDSTANVSDSSCTYPGCTDSTAFNYDPLAMCDDGSCVAIVYGCTDLLASNYNPNATVDDGSCIYPNTCGPITGVNLTDVIHDRATFNWDDMNNTSCVVDQIRIRYREVGTNSYSTKTMGSPVGNNAPCLNTSKLVLNLMSSTTYEYDFKIWYQDGTVVTWHANGNFTTLPLCDNVINIIPTPITTTKTQFCWDTVSTYAFVRLKYREDVPGSSFSNIGGMGVNSPTLCKDKNGLTPGLTYRVMWRTWCNPSGGPYRSAQWDGPVLWSQPNSIRVDELSSINSLEVYPNPSRDVFNVEFTSETKQTIEVRLVNLVGEIIFTENLVDFDGEYSHSFNLSEYSKGIYLLELDTDNGIVNKKLILQ